MGAATASVEAGWGPRQPIVQGEVEPTGIVT